MKNIFKEDVELPGCMTQVMRLFAWGITLIIILIK